MPSVAATVTGLITFGRMWLMMILRCRVPMLRLARMNSCCLIDSTSPRTMRAVCIQLVAPMTVTINTNVPTS